MRCASLCEEESEGRRQTLEGELQQQQGSQREFHYPSLAERECALSSLRASFCLCFPSALF